MVEAINKVVRTSRQMLNEIGREPTPEGLAEKLGMPLEKVRKVLKIAKEPLSLETPIGDEEDSHLGDFIVPVLRRRILMPGVRAKSMIAWPGNVASQAKASRFPSLTA